MINTMQYICDAAGQKIAVVVPIDLWQEIMSEKETAYLLSSPTMRERLLTAKNRQNGISFIESLNALSLEEKHQLWQILETALFQAEEENWIEDDDTISQREGYANAEIQQVREEYVTFDRYLAKKPS